MKRSTAAQRVTAARTAGCHGSDYSFGVSRVGLSVGSVLVVLGIFWAGRESTHGLSAFYEHWWCPIPVAMIVVGSVVGVAPRLGRPHAS
jgi:hypothetical protein